MRLLALSIPLLLACTAAQAQTGFEKVRCDADIPKAMIGQKAGPGKVVDLEAKFSALGLKHLGADIITDNINTVSWRICGKEFVVLEKSNRIADVIEFPAHDKHTPAFSVMCRVNGRMSKEAYIGTLDNRDPKADMLPVVTAWRIDEKRVKFVPAKTEGMLCPRSGIITADGGR